MVSKLADAYVCFVLQEDSTRITMQATGALSWRRADVKYRKNEAFVDVIEDVNLLMSAGGMYIFHPTDLVSCFCNF